MGTQDQFQVLHQYSAKLFEDVPLASDQHQAPDLEQIRIMQEAPKEMHLLAGPPLRHSQAPEPKVAMLPKHGADEAYALPSLPKATRAAVVGEIIHPPVPDYLWAAQRGGFPPSMAAPPSM